MLSSTRRDETGFRRSRQERIQRQLQRSSEERSRLRRRNALVLAHLPLARSVAARIGASRHGSLDDMMQVASLGLIRAVEAFDPARAVRFSSFAVPYLRGALLHELRDRQSSVRIPRPLWELRQQASLLQENRRRQGKRPLDRRSLARQLACAMEQLLEVEMLGAVSTPRSLDAPIGDDGSGSTLLDRLADPRSLAAEAEPAADLQPAEQAERDAEEAMNRWLAERLAALEPTRRELVEGRLNQNCTWVELGQRLGIHPRMAQRRCDATLAELRAAATLWRQEQTISSTRRAAEPEPRRAGPRPESGAR